MKIAVLCGGLSNERDVSISTGTGAARALRALGHQVVLMDLFLGYPRPFADASEVFTVREELGSAAIGDHSPDLDDLAAQMDRQLVEHGGLGAHRLIPLHVNDNVADADFTSFSGTPMTIP